MGEQASAATEIEDGGAREEVRAEVIDLAGVPGAAVELDGATVLGLAARAGAGEVGFAGGVHVVGRSSGAFRPIASDHSDASVILTRGRARRAFR